VKGRVLAPFLAAALGLAGSLAATLALHSSARGAVDRVLEERLRAAGESARRTDTSTRCAVSQGSPPSRRSS